jgi:hypothetical protein
VQQGAEIQADSKLLSGLPFIGHGNPDNNLDSPLNNNNNNKKANIHVTDWRLQQWGRIFTMSLSIYLSMYLSIYPSMALQPLRTLAAF